MGGNDNFIETSKYMVIPGRILSFFPAIFSEGDCQMILLDGAGYRSNAVVSYENHNYAMLLYVKDNHP